MGRTLQRLPASAIVIQDGLCSIIVIGGSRRGPHLLSTMVASLVLEPPGLV